MTLMIRAVCPSVLLGRIRIIGTVMNPGWCEGPGVARLHQKAEEGSIVRYTRTVYIKGI
jgi:hypothetical protein